MPYKEGRKWRAKITIMGKRYTALMATKKEALVWETAKRKEIKQSAENSHHGLDLLTFCSKYTIYSERFSKKVYDEKKSLCQRVMKFWGPTTPTPNITAGIVQSYLDEQAATRSANASNRDRKNLLAMWNYGCKFLGLQENPVSVTAKRAHDRKPPYTPPTEDVLKVLMVATREERVLLDCYLHTAARRSEIFRLTWVEDINFERRKIRLGTRKTKDGSMQYTWLPMADELHASLSWWWEHRKFRQSPYVFVDDHPGPNYGMPYKVRRRFTRSLCERAGVKPFGFHALRRFVASRLADMGKSTKTIQQLLRHKKLHTTERYIQSINDGLKGVTDGLFEEKGTKPRHENQKGYDRNSVTH